MQPYDSVGDLRWRPFGPPFPYACLALRTCVWYGTVYLATIDENMSLNGSFIILKYRHQNHESIK